MRSRSRHLLSMVVVSVVVIAMGGWALADREGGGKAGSKKAQRHQEGRAPRKAQEFEIEIPLKMVPPSVKEAASKVSEGIKLSEAELEIEGREVEFTLEGTLDGKEVEIEVKGALKVVKVESGDDEEEVEDKAEAKENEDADQNEAGDDRDEGEENEFEAEIPLKAVPRAVRAATKKAVKGVKWTEAELCIEGEEIEFVLEGKLDGKEVEVEVETKFIVKKARIEDEKDDRDDADDKEKDE